MESVREKWNIVGGFHNLADHFLATVQTRPLVPLVCGEDPKPVCALHVGERLMVVHREHMGYFIPPGRDETLPTSGPFGPANLDLKRAQSHAQAVLDNDGQPADAKTAKAVEPSRDPYEQLEALAKHFDASEITCRTKQDRSNTLVRALTRKVLFPALCFLDLAQAYVATLVDEDASGFETIRTLASMLVPERLLPTGYTRAVFLPLMVPCLTSKNTTVTIDGDAVEVVHHALRFRPFRGFGYRSEPPQSSVPWNGLDESGQVIHDLPISLSSPQEAASVHRTVNQLRKASCPKGSSAEKLFGALGDWDEVVLVDPDYADHTHVAKAVRRFFGTVTGLGVLQTQVSLITPHWSVEDVLELGRAEGEALKALRMMSRTRCSRTCLTLQCFNHNAFAYDDAEAVTTERNNTSEAAGNATGIMYPILFGGYNAKHRSAAAAQHRLNDLGLERIRPLVPQTASRRIMQLGLWCVFNSTECSEFGNLANHPPETASKRPESKEIHYLERSTTSRWVYELKTMPITEPGNVLGWVYNARMALLTTVAGAHASCFELDSSKSPEELLHAVTSEAIKFATRGMFVRTKDVLNTGLTFSVSHNSLTTKGYAITRSDKAPAINTLSAFKRISWLEPGADDSPRLQYLLDNYNLRKLLLDLNGQFGFFYKRLTWCSPWGNPLSNGTVLRQKNLHVNAPVAFLAGHGLYDGQGKWYVTNLETDQPWKSINVYRVAIDNNGMYTADTRASWSRGGERSLGITEEAGWNQVFNELLETIDERTPVRSSDINNYPLTQASYQALVDKLQEHNRYERDVPEKYISCDGPDDEEDSGECSARAEPSGSKRRAGTPRTEDELSHDIQETLLKRSRISF